MYVESFICARLMNDLWYGLLGYEIDKPSKILIKTLNIVDYIESNI